MMTRHPGTGGSVALGKMILSLYNDENCFAFRECVDGRDCEITQVCLDMAACYAQRGEDEALRAAGRLACETYPHLPEIGYAGHLAKRAAGERD